MGMLKELVRIEGGWVIIGSKLVGNRFSLAADQSNRRF